MTINSHSTQLLRRAFLQRTGLGIGSAALSWLLQGERAGGAVTSGADSSRWTGVVQPLHYPARCRRVIHLYMAGGPSHLETLDYKPKLAELDGQPMPRSVTEGQQIAQLQGEANNLKILGPQHSFVRQGQSGQMISSILPSIGRVADELCVIRSLHTDQINHDPAHTLMNTGSGIPGRPSMGSWVLYGLGSESDDLPGYVVLTSVGGGQAQPIASRQWHSGFLPSRFQGVELRSQGEPVLYIQSPGNLPLDRQAGLIRAVEQLNQIGFQTYQDPEILTRITQYELAFKMQTSVPKLADISDEPQHILDLYGTKGGDGSFGANCLLARRLAERGVRFVQVYHRGWDHHGGVKEGAQTTAGLVDQASGALITDLKQRGMLDDTLVLWGGEFGRTPMAQGSGRDHHIKGFSMWMAGGGVRGGISHGATDDLGYHAVENRVHVNDLHATLLHLFGIDHTRLTYRFQGRDYRLTDIAGTVVHPILKD